MSHRPTVLHEVAFDDPRVVPLLSALDAELTARYDNADEVFPPPDAASYASPHGTCLLAEVGSLSPLTPVSMLRARAADVTDMTDRATEPAR